MSSRTREATSLVPHYVDSFWTSAQRQASAIHEISYRACFKPQVPRFFIEQYTKEGDVVYDPFMGRGTTVIEAVLLGRKAIGNDVNPLSLLLVEPRLNIPTLQQVSGRLGIIPTRRFIRSDVNLSMFYHPETLRELLSLRTYLRARRRSGTEDHVDKWIRMIATNRLTGHSSGFFSVYTLPPNQATTPANQIRINRKRRQKPAYRNVRELILRKTKRMLNAIDGRDVERLSRAGDNVVLLNEDARRTHSIATGSVQLTVTSPPFLDTVDYASDNWLRCWFNDIHPRKIAALITRARSVDEWADVMRQVFGELYRITKSGGRVAFEVGEIRRRTIALDEVVVPLGRDAGFRVESVFINKQRFTKTSHIWGIQNNRKGTNTNRIVLFHKT